MILINPNLFSFKAKMTPNQFMIFMYGIGMDYDVDVKELERLTGINNVEEELKALEELGYYFEGRMSSKFIGVTEMRGKQRPPRMISKKDTPEAYKDVIDLFDKSYSMYIGVANKGLVRIDWSDKVVRGTIINIINKINTKLEAKYEVYPSKQDTLKAIASMLQFCYNDEFWVNHIHPSNFIKNMDKILASMINAKKK